MSVHCEIRQWHAKLAKGIFPSMEIMIFDYFIFSVASDDQIPSTQTEIQPNWYKIWIPVFSKVFFFFTSFHYFVRMLVQNVQNKKVICNIKWVLSQSAFWWFNINKSCSKTNFSYDSNVEIAIMHLFKRICCDSIAKSNTTKSRINKAQLSKQNKTNIFSNGTFSI